MSAIKLLLSLIHPLEIIKGFTLWGGGGGGGGTQTGTQTNISELPEWARGYAKDTLAKGAALTDTSQNPYQTYDQPRIAGFSPLQQQSQDAAANMQTNAGTGAGMDIAGAAALGGLNQNYNGMQARTQNFGDRSAAQYMDPYAMQALQPTLNEQARQAQIQGNQLQAKAVGQGAFGGSRQGLEQAENQRNLGILQGNTIAQGMNTAYNNATQQFNADQARQLQAQGMNQNQQQFGANLGLQGLNTALQGASQLGSLGQQQFQQGMDINKLQNAYGGQQQALQQQGLDTAYNDFLNQQNYPYKQLGFMSDLIRGLPLGQQSTSAVYQANPTTAQTATSLGLGAYGLSKFMAKGGLAYADGGSVESTGNVDNIVSKLSDTQLQAALQAAQGRGDVDEVEAIQNEMGMRASERRGIASSVTPQMVQKMAGGGGVLAFYKGGATPSDSEDSDTDTNINTDVELQGQADPSIKRLWQQANARIGAFTPSSAMTQEQRDASDQANFERFQKFGGPDPYTPMADKLAKFDTDRAKSLEEAKGLAALQAIPAVMQGGNALRGIGAGVGALGTGLASAAKADSEEKRSLASMQFNLADAQRKERMGLTKDAITATTEAQKDRVAADKAKLAALVAQAKSATDAGRAFRTTGAGAGAGGKDFIVGPSAYLGQIQEEHPDWTPAKQKAEAFKQFQAGKSAGLPGAENRTDAAVVAAATSSWDKMNNLQRKNWAEGNGIDTNKKGWTADAQSKYTQSQQAAAGRTKPNAAPPAQGVKVVANGKTFNFPDQASADQFKAAAGIK